MWPSIMSDQSCDQVDEYKRCQQILQVTHLWRSFQGGDSKSVDSILF